MKKHAVLLLVVILVFTLLAGCGSGKAPASSAGGASASGEAAFKPVTLKLGHVNQLDHPYTLGAQKFKQIVEEKTNNDITIDIFEGGTLGNERELIEQCSMGSTELIVVASSPFANTVPEFLVYDLPFLFRDRAHAYAVLDGDIGTGILEKMSGSGVIGLNYWENGFRHMSNSLREVKTPSDSQGLKIRVMENELYISTFNAMGALPTPMAWSEVFTALQQKTIDGMENSPTIYVTSSLYDVQKYLSLTGHFYSPAIFGINEQLFNSLPADYQQIIMEAAEEAKDYERKMHEELDDTNVEVLKEKGMVITEVDTAAFVEAVQPVYEKYAPQIGQELIDAVLAVK